MGVDEDDRNKKKKTSCNSKCLRYFVYFPPCQARLIVGTAEAADGVEIGSSDKAEMQCEFYLF